MIAFPAFVVEAHDAFAPDDVDQPVLQSVGSGLHRLRHTPDRHLDDAAVVADILEVGDERSLHVGNFDNTAREVKRAAVAPRACGRAYDVNGLLSGTDALGAPLQHAIYASDDNAATSAWSTRRAITIEGVVDGNAVDPDILRVDHKAAIEMLIEDADEVGFNAFTFKNLHAVLSQDLIRDPHASGRLRRRPVEISGTVFHPLALPQVIEDCFTLLLTKAGAIPDPFEQAFFLMVQLPYLQPFEDVNKRVSRIGANIPLFKHNLCPLSFIDVPEHAYREGTLGVYELDRIELLSDVFVWAYERSCQRYLAIAQTMVEPDPLKIKYREALIQAVQSIVKGLRQPGPVVIAEVAQDHATGDDQAAFRDLLTSALQQLHEGRIARYRLRRSEYIAWQHAQAQA